MLFFATKWGASVLQLKWYYKVIQVGTKDQIAAQNNLILLEIWQQIQSTDKIYVPQKLSDLVHLVLDSNLSHKEWGAA